MRNGRTALGVLLAALCAGPATAGEWPKSLACEFTAGTSGSYENGVFQSKPAEPVGFDIRDVDLEKLSAVLEAGTGHRPGKLAIARAIGANHFLEIANEGFWNVTTIYDADPATGEHPAVHSRHLGVVGSPVFAQYTGTCKVK
jgi:hypothetical protein